MGKDEPLLIVAAVLFKVKSVGLEMTLKSVLVLSVLTFAAGVTAGAAAEAAATRLCGGDAAGHEAGEEHEVVGRLRVGDPEDAHRRAHRGPVREVLRVGQKQVDVLIGDHGAAIDFLLAHAAPLRRNIDRLSAARDEAGTACPSPRCSFPPIVRSG